MKDLKRHLYYWALILWAFFVSANVTAGNVIYPKREFRGAWVTTVMNIDFPSRAGLSYNDLKSEVIQLLDYLQDQRINAVFFQVRPSADAFFKSSYEPASKYLTGKFGEDPTSQPDMLDFVLEECHQRAMECHAWINPFRALASPDSVTLNEFRDRFAKDSLCFIKYGRNLYFDPGEPRNRDRVLNIVAELLRNYNVDGIHFDDYFYPYKIKGETFNDTASYQLYGNGRNLDDWRRENVNDLIKRTSDTLAYYSPYGKFGVSPFGVWRNKREDPRGSATRAGTTAYDVLYADVLFWMDRGWLDYVAPQLYWPIGYEPADYQKLVNWWNKHSNGCHIYVGHSIFKIDPKATNKAWSDENEINRQISLNRGLKNVKGSVFFNTSSLKRNKLGVSDNLRRNLYPYYALTPLMPWKIQVKCEAPEKVKLNNEVDGVLIQWEDTNDSNCAGYVVYRFEGRKVKDLENAGNIRKIVSRRCNRFYDRAVQRGKKYTYLISAISKSGLESIKKSELTIKFR